MNQSNWLSLLVLVLALVLCMMLFFTFWLLFLFSPNLVRIAYYYMQTVLDESANYSGMNGNNFQGGWVDSLGTVYFSKPSTFAVQKLSPDGNTSLIIGPSSQGVSGASSPATSVQLDSFDSIYEDTSGNLYISSGMYFIWKYDRSSEIVSRIAGATPIALGFSGNGGQATVATLNGPQGMFVALLVLTVFYLLLIAPIWTIKTTSRIINTFAGNLNSGNTGDLGPATSAALSLPTSVWGSSDGVIYIANSGSNLIRQVDTSGIIRTFAGNGLTAYNGENIPATSSGMSVYSVCGDSNGNIFLSHGNGDFRIRMIKDGIISTIAGNGKGVGKPTQVIVSANTTIPPSNRVFADPASGAIYFTSYDSANILVDSIETATPTNIPTKVPTDSPTFVPSYQVTETPTIAPTEVPSTSPTTVPSMIPTNNPTTSPTNPPGTPSAIPSFRPSSSPTNYNNNNNNNSTLNSHSHSNERMSDLHIFYATFFPAFFVLCCMFFSLLCYKKKKNHEKDNHSNGLEKNAYEKVGGEGDGVVVKQERFYEMWF